MVKTERDNKRGELAHVRILHSPHHVIESFLDFNHLHLRLALESGLFFSGLLVGILCFEKVTNNADVSLSK